MEQALKVKKDTNALYDFSMTEMNKVSENINPAELYELKDKWIGEEVESVADGVYVLEGKEYTVQDSVLTAMWSLPDQNQLSIEEL